MGSCKRGLLKIVGAELIIGLALPVSHTAASQQQKFNKLPLNLNTSNFQTFSIDMSQIVLKNGHYAHAIALPKLLHCSHSILIRKMFVMMIIITYIANTNVNDVNYKSCHKDQY